MYINILSVTFEYFLTQNSEIFAYVEVQFYPILPHCLLIDYFKQCNFKIIIAYYTKDFIEGKIFQFFSILSIKLFACKFKIEHHVNITLALQRVNRHTWHFEDISK
jgi:hypothetical protein